MTMLSNETVRKLHEMRLGVMAEAFSTQLEDVQFQSVSFEDRFAMLVDAEWSARKSNRLGRLPQVVGYLHTQEGDRLISDRGRWCQLHNAFPPSGGLPSAAGCLLWPSSRHRRRGRRRG